jgi:hypothetical protein
MYLLELKDVYSFNQGSTAWFSFGDGSEEAFQAYQVSLRDL